MAVVIVSVFLSALCSWLVTRRLTSRLLEHFIDHPNERSSHNRATPRGGGVSFVIVACACSLISFFADEVSAASALPLLAAPLSFIGLLDDRYNLPLSLRYVVQFLTAGFILLVSPLSLSLFVSFSFFKIFLLPGVAFLLIAFTAVINFTNFMDGLDGLVAGCIAVAMCAVAIRLSAPLPLFSLVGALTGFLVLNWSPAKVFMGDVGSTFLGAVFAGLVLQASSWSDAFGCLLVATPLLGDACLCVPRRLLAGQKVFQAHRLHLFQRLHQAGWTHARVSLAYIAATAVLAVAMLTGGWPWVFSLAVSELLLGVWLDQHVAVPFAVASKS